VTAVTLRRITPALAASSAAPAGRSRLRSIGPATTKRHLRQNPLTGSPAAPGPRSLSLLARTRFGSTRRTTSKGNSPIVWSRFASPAWKSWFRLKGRSHSLVFSLRLDEDEGPRGSTVPSLRPRSCGMLVPGTPWNTCDTSKMGSPKNVILANYDFGTPLFRCVLGVPGVPTAFRVLRPNLRRLQA
jgi:hypothetical protein